MTKRRRNSVGKKAATEVDPLALAELQAASIEARIRRGLPLTKRQKAWWNAELAQALQKRHALPRLCRSIASLVPGFDR